LAGGADKLVGFFLGGRDSEGRTLQEILEWGDETLEDVHDYIQWVFPTRRPSDFNPDAPVLTEETIAAFAREPVLRARLVLVLRRMLRFYGFELRDEAGVPVVHRGPSWAERSVWISPGDHNLLRITRILDSLSTLGLAGHARAFLDALLELEPQDEGRAIGPRTFRFWREAVSAPPRSPGT
jgi:hypothetical protein